MCKFNLLPTHYKGSVTVACHCFFYCYLSDKQENGLFGKLPCLP